MFETLVSRSHFHPSLRLLGKHRFDCTFLLPFVSTRHLLSCSNLRLKLTSFVAETIKVPKMAESITEGTLKSCLKQVGNTIAAEEEVANIETDEIGSRLIVYGTHSQ